MKRLFYRWGGLIAIAAVAALFLAFRVPQSVLALKQRHQHIHELQKENAEAAKENAEKKARIEELRTNPKAREIEVRKRLKLQREGETTFIPQDGKPAK